MRNAAFLASLTVFAACGAGSGGAWFLSRDCSGPDLVLSVGFDGEDVFESRGSACDDYRDNRNGEWEKEKLSFVFKPNRAITWTGYREEPFSNAPDATLTVDLWLAGADAESRLWYIGVTVSGDDAIYTNTIHPAVLTDRSETCPAPTFCVKSVID